MKSRLLRAALKALHYVVSTHSSRLFSHHVLHPIPSQRIPRGPLNTPCLFPPPCLWHALPPAHDTPKDVISRWHQSALKTCPHKIKGMSSGNIEWVPQIIVVKPKLRKLYINVVWKILHGFEADLRMIQKCAPMCEQFAVLMLCCCPMTGLRGTIRGASVTCSGR